MTDDMMLTPAESGINEVDANAQFIGNLISQMLTPILEPLAKCMQHQTEVMDRIATSQRILTDRMENLEKQVRLNTPLTPTQARHIADAMRKRARELLDGKGYADDAKAVRALTGSIRKYINSRYGSATIGEIPRHEYSVVMEQVALWNDMILVRDVVKAARKRKDGNK